LVHRLRDTAKVLWLIYALLTLVGTLVLAVLGLSVYDALCHTLTSLSTGGYSTHTTSIAHFADMGTYEVIQSVLVLLMVAGSVNFVLHYNALIRLRPRSYGRSPELRSYLGIIIVAACVLAIVLTLNRTYGPGRSLMGAVFTTVSVISTTGFATEDFSLWPIFAQFVVLLLMLSGGMTSSTTGGVKIARFMVAVKAVRRSLRRIGHPMAVSPIRLGGILVPEPIIRTIGMFIFGYFLTFLIGSFLLSITGLDVLSALSASASSLGNVGPALGTLGPFANFSEVNVAAKVILIALMWLGRLELVTGVVLFLPSTYRH
jgi:trk system potassium uptake protein TrkH